MTRSKRVRSDSVTTSSPTGTGFQDEPEEDVVASDTSSGGIGPTASIGRTPSDLLYESGVSKALSRFVGEIDPVELLFITAYVILSGWGNSQHPIWPFSYFGLSILGYHLFGRPITTYLMRRANRRSAIGQDHG